MSGENSRVKHWFITRSAVNRIRMLLCSSLSRSITLIRPFRSLRRMRFAGNRISLSNGWSVPTNSVTPA